MLPIAPLQGRFLVRRLGDGHTILAGTLRLPVAMAIQEGALYIAQWSEAGLSLLPTPAMDALEEEHRALDLNGWLRAPLWPRTRDPRVFGIRFVEAFPGANQWSFAAVTGDINVATDAAGHAWLDVAEGACTPIKAPVDARGESIAGLLNGHAVWPGPDGAMWTSSTLPSWQRPIYARYHRLLVDVGRGVRSIEDVRACVRRDADLATLCSGSIDPDFCDYLAALGEEGMTSGADPVPAECLRSRQESARAACEALVVGARARELNGLAQLGVR